MNALAAEVDSTLSAAFARLDFASVKRTFDQQDEFVFLPAILPAELTARMAAEATSADLARHRSRLPFIRSAGHVGYRELAARAPTVVALYRSPAFLAFMSRLTGKPMYLKHDEDDHACATYEYTRRGDGMRFHYDTCGCEEGASYSMIIGLVDRSSQRLLVDLHRDKPDLRRRLALEVRPGAMALFCGSKVWHGVSPLGRDERRVVLSLAYASNPAMPPARRFVENLKDAALYFGPGALFQKNYSSRPAGGPLSVLVTGASSGIGAAVALEYARRGARLGLFARRKERLEEVAHACVAAGAADARAVDGDTTDRARVDAACAGMVDAFGRLDRAYLNAGGYDVGGVDDMARTRREWSSDGFSADSAERVMRVNYMGVLYWLEPVLARMREQRAGTVALTGAQAADRGYPKHGPYAASKAALRALADSLRADAARHGVTVSLIEPGCVESGLTEARCCDEMPFLQPTGRSAQRIVRGVEAGRPVIRFPWHGSLLSRAAAATPRALFDRWAARQFEPGEPR